MMIRSGVALCVWLTASVAHADSFLPGGEDLTAWKISYECPSGTITRNAAEGSTTFCVPQMTKETRRCEVALTGPDVRQKNLEVDFDLKLDAAAARPNAPIILFQIHSHPDPGEVWRCPMAAMRSIPGDAMDMGGAFDKNKISKPAPGTCLGTGSTLQGYRVFHRPGMAPDQWSSFQFKYYLTLNESGSVEVLKDRVSIGHSNGPNIYNDVAPPALKMGVYGEPSGQFGPICSTIRNFRLRY